MDDVDDFVDRVLSALDGAVELTVDQVRAVVFRPRRGGYREQSVDDALDRVVEHLMLHSKQEGALGT
jgi:DivIVA domain-containing protein